MRSGLVGLAAGLGAAALLLSGCGQTPSEDEMKRAIAAGFSDCQGWESLPEGQELIPGVGTEWVMGCQSSAAAFALEDPAEICDFWARSGEGPTQFAASLDGKVLVLDLNGRDQSGAVRLATNNPELFAVATRDAYCAADGWEPPSDGDRAESEANFQEACGLWESAMVLPAQDEKAREAVGGASSAVDESLRLNPGNGGASTLRSAIDEYMVQTALIVSGNDLADVDSWNAAMESGVAACGKTLDELLQASTAAERESASSGPAGNTTGSAGAESAASASAADCDVSVASVSDPVVLAQLAQCPSAETRSGVGADESTPMDTLRILATDADPLVRRSVAGNPGLLSSEIFSTLLEDEDASVRARLFTVHFQDLTDQQTAQLIADESAEVRAAVARRSYRLTPEQQQILANDQDSMVVSFLITDLGSFIEGLDASEVKRERKVLKFACSRGLRLESAAQQVCADLP